MANCKILNVSRVPGINFYQFRHLSVTVQISSPSLLCHCYRALCIPEPQKVGFLNVGEVSDSFAKWSVYLLSFYFKVSELYTREREACTIFFRM